MLRLATARTLQRKLTLILLATIGLALFLAASALLLVELRKEYRNARQDLVVQADVVGLASEAALTFGDAKVGEQNLRVLQAQPQVIAGALYDIRGRLFAHFLSGEDGSAEVPAQAPPLGMHFGLSTATVVRPVISNREQIGRVYVQLQHGLLAEVAEYVGWLVLVVLVSLFGALLLARRLQPALTEPIEDVSAVARGVLEHGNYDLRATKRSQDEVGRLVDAFNAMLDELGRRSRMQQETNRALSASDARYQLAARGSSAGLWDWDMDAGTMFYSPRFKALLGYSEEEFPDLPTSLLNVMHEDDRQPVQAALRSHLSHDTPFQVECRLQEKRGPWRWFLVTGMALRDEKARAFRMAGSLIDISERKQTEILLQQSNRAKDEFLATLAHELRNPLAPLRTGLQILKRPDVAEGIQKRTLVTMDRQLTHMVRLIDDLLDISRINSGKIRLELARSSLRAALQTALELARPAMDSAGHVLEVQLPEPDIALHADETRLAQAFGNLLNNAAKYTPRGGRIALRAWQDGQQACVEIQDSGIGIPPEMLDRVFSLFAQVDGHAGTSGGGLGIGLFLVRGLVEMHGGTVEASSGGDNQGSTFLVRLPCLPPAAAPAPVPPREDDRTLPGSAAPGRVLVVDDNLDAADTLATLLDMLGLQTRQVHDGEGVLAAALEFRPEVVLLDIGLPGMDGYEVARALRGEPRLGRVTLIALTGWGAEDDRRRALAAGFDHHLTKPVDLAVLEQMLRTLQLEQRT
ncbi:ATP-binding protein [Ramlibacter sp. XY19]|uniref:ATP-binding protein n=1 Tax=Ramlibacter paludis TaxID=2908000 RepID=UPI0023DA74A3|nr:ATP-binding protein [Ramlibacter paludis]MCG2595669.1 ATP-binding protein [Ramlibacter paludis]